MGETRGRLFGGGPVGRKEMGLSEPNPPGILVMSLEVDLSVTGRECSGGKSDGILGIARANPPPAA